MMQCILAQPGDTYSLSESVFEAQPIRRLLEHESSSGRYETECGGMLDDSELWSIMEARAKRQLKCLSLETVEWWELLAAAIYYSEKVKFGAKHRERTTPDSFPSYELKVEFFVDVVRILFLFRVMQGHRHFQQDRIAVDKVSNYQSQYTVQTSLTVNVKGD